MGHADLLALRAWALLANGMGAVDWSGLPVVAAYLDVDDVEGLVDRLHVIKTHKGPTLGAE